MKRRRNSTLVALATGLATIGLAAGALYPAFGQEAPESLLPPGFGQPAPPRAPASVPNISPAAPAAVPVLTIEPEILAGIDAAPIAEPLELPDSARRSIDLIGAISGFGPQTFGVADGRYLSTLMRRLDVPIASRWAAITLRRALASRVETPSRISAADWVAERAWLLLRMGEADAARMLVQSVDVDRFNAKLYAVAAQAALATADPAGLCPLANGGAIRSKDAIWPMARAVCASLSGDTAIAGVLMDQARRRTRDPQGIDVQLAEKMMGVNGGGQRSVSIEWTGVNQLTSWRFGMASALGVPIPADLMTTVGPQVQAWQARTPMLPASERLGAALVAARLGVYSSAALIDLYGAIGDETEEFSRESPAGRLRACYVADDDSSRVSAMRSFWSADIENDEFAPDPYVARILTARAAVRIAPSSDFERDAAPLIGAMMSAGLDRKAMRWAQIVSAMSAEEADPAWAILAVGAPRVVVDISASRIDSFGERMGDANIHKTRMLIAALAGLNRLSSKDQQSLAEDYGVRFDTRSLWARMLSRAVDERQPGTVALLVAAGMQNTGWQGVPPSQFYAMLAALKNVGLQGEARMIAAEAMTRL